MLIVFLHKHNLMSLVNTQWHIQSNQLSNTQDFLISNLDVQNWLLTHDFGNLSLYVLPWSFGGYSSSNEVVPFFSESVLPLNKMAAERM